MSYTNNRNNVDDVGNNPYQSDLDIEEYYQTAISKLSKQEIDTYHQLTRDSIGDVKLEDLRLGFEGIEYRRFIKEHFHMMSCDELLMGIAGKFAAFNPIEREAAKTVLKLYDQYALDGNFWLADTSKVLYDMSKSFEEILKAKNCQVEDKMKFNLFQLISSNLAVIALHDKELRKIAHIRKSWFIRP
ncbi:MAG TPA: hypothetical protein VMW72_01870 [Sedimentisphaerales bacterium]|nr:hypothetical protein [Sedimentisphaerales bacterium]